MTTLPVTPLPVTLPDPGRTRPGAWPSRRNAFPTGRGPVVGLRLLLPVALGLAACDAGERADPHPEPNAAPAEEAEHSGPGLHTLMMELQHRHATLWFAGDAGNWPLADYFMHELEELLEDIETLHPTYDGIPVADLLTEMTPPAVHRLEAAVDAADREGFRTAYDELTTACNACHTASDRAAIVMQRPTAPPLTNLRYVPGPGR